MFKTLKSLCTPALIYFVISIIGIIMLSFQNMNDNRRYNMGSFSCRVPSCIFIFILKLIYILFWTWILNLICKSGHKAIAWLLLLLPFILLFSIIALIMFNQ